MQQPVEQDTCACNKNRNWRKSVDEKVSSREYLIALFWKRLTVLSAFYWNIYLQLVLSSTPVVLLEKEEVVLSFRFFSLCRKVAVLFLESVTTAKQRMAKWSGMDSEISSFQFTKQCTLFRWGAKCAQGRLHSLCM